MQVMILQQRQRCCAQLVCQGNVRLHQVGKVHDKQCILRVVLKQLLKVFFPDVWYSCTCVCQISADGKVSFPLAILHDKCMLKGGSR